jgi:hypothetical protein
LSRCRLGPDLVDETDKENSDVNSNDPEYNPPPHSGTQPPNDDSAEESDGTTGSTGNQGTSSGGPAPPPTKLTDDEANWRKAEAMFERVRQLAPAILAASRRYAQFQESGNQNTLRDYAQKFANLTKSLGDPGVRPDRQKWVLSLVKYHGNKSSFKANRAALCHGLRGMVRQLLDDQERVHQTLGEREDWCDKVVRLNALLKILSAIEDAPYSADIWKKHGGEPRQGSRKGRELLQLAKQHPNWRPKLLYGMRGTGYLNQTRVSILVGLRPSEFTDGAVITRYDESSFAILVKGKKVTSTSGQPWRRVILPNRRLPREWRQRLQADGSIVIQTDSAAAYKESMGRVSERLFPGLPRVTPYSFRHNIRTELLTDGTATREVISGVMGHAVEETQTAYGSRPRGKRRRPDQKHGIKVETARPIKARNMSGLHEVRAKREKVQAPKARGPA